MKSFTVALLAASVSAGIIQAPVKPLAVKGVVGVKGAGIGLGKGLGLGLGGVKGHGVGYGAQAGYGSYSKVDLIPQTKLVQPAKSAQAASKGYGSDYSKKTTTDWDAWGRDQDLAIDESYGKTNAKSYRAESYDEWDNEDADQWGGQGWGRDYDQYGRSSHEYDASKGAAGAGKAYNASWQGDAQASGYDNDAWAKQAYGQDYDSRWGKSYDSVEARNYANEHYARKVRADDDQWAEDRDQYAKGSAAQAAAAASAQRGKIINSAASKD